MMLTVETRHAVDPEAARRMDAAELRRSFHACEPFRYGRIRLVYSHYDWMILGGAVPGSAPLVLDHVRRSGALPHPVGPGAPGLPGSAEAANERTINQFVHPELMESSQLVVGYAKLESGSVWNIMPAHHHNRRMKAYVSFDLAEDARVFHDMGRPGETRHLVMKNEEAAISPP